MSARGTIISAIKTMLGKITTEPVGETPSPYSTDFDAVYEWKTTPFSADEQAVNVMDLMDDIEEEERNVFHKHTLHVEIQIKMATGKSISDVRTAVTDVYKAISLDSTWDNVKYMMMPEGDEIGVEQDEYTYFTASIKLAVQFRTPAWSASVINS